MVNVKLLLEEIDTVGVPKTVLAEKCGITTQGLYKKLEKPSTITADEAAILADALRITDPQRLLEIFFAPKVEGEVNI